MFENVPKQIKLDLADDYIELDTENFPGAEENPEAWKRFKLKIHMENVKTVKDKLIYMDKVVKFGFKHASKVRKSSDGMLNAFLEMLDECEDYDAFQRRLEFIKNTLEAKNNGEDINAVEERQPDSPPEYVA